MIQKLKLWQKVFNMKLSSIELQHPEASVGKNIVHDAGITHVTGESIYIDDRPRLQNEVDVFVVGAPIAHGEVLKVDFSEALKVKGILAIYDYRDLHHNVWGPIVEEQPLLVEKVVRHYDEPILIVAAESREIFETAKKKIKFEFIALPGIFSIDEAIDKNTALYTATPFVRGEVDKALADSDHVIKGSFECGGQEHFYLESQASIVYPMENGQLEVHASSQHPTETQHLVAHAIGLGFHEVVCIVKRMGGGFGGKESQAAPFAAYAALVAHKLKRPARLVLTKDEDMQMTGKRHPFKFFYQLGFSTEGKINGLKVKIYSDAGAYADLSSSILERAMFHIDGSYYIPTCLIEGFAMRTNHLSNTAFRGFGGPQGNLCIEAIMEEVAKTVKKDSLDVRKLNLYSSETGLTTPYGQEVEHNVLPELFKQLELSSGYQQRLIEIRNFNKEVSRTKKIRSLSMTGCKFGIAFTARFLNQGNALVNLHRDGTVQVSTGATEMGQGVNTKIQQIVATCLGIPAKNVKIMATSTEKNHNTSPTAASSGADINGSAAFLAATKIKKRLVSLIQKLERGLPSDDIHEIEVHENDISDEVLEKYLFVNDEVITPENNKYGLKDLILKAYFNRISLAGYAFFKTEGLGFSKKLGSGKAFNYFTNGAAVSEVVIDLYTGESKVVRTDILMDLGRPINPGIDQGQVTGAFIQGMGWVTNEKLFYGKEMNLVSHSPTTYKIPSIQDTPRIFNVAFLTNPHPTPNVYKSKAVGEPPFLLSASVFTAIKKALLEKCQKTELNLKSPATNEEILLATKR